PGAGRPWNLGLEPSLGVEPWDLILPKVADFGLARPVQEATGLTVTGTLLGTPEYMAPEQAAGSGPALGPSADLYALGVILYRLGAGGVPFKGATVYDTLRLVGEREPEPLRQRQPSCPADLDTICRKCLRKDPGQRYPTAEALADDLRRFQGGEPI